MRTRRATGMPHDAPDPQCRTAVFHPELIVALSRLMGSVKTPKELLTGVRTAANLLRCGRGGLSPALMACLGAVALACLWPTSLGVSWSVSGDGRSVEVKPGDNLSAIVDRSRPRLHSYVRQVSTAVKPFAPRTAIPSWANRGRF